MKKKIIAIISITLIVVCIVISKNKIISKSNYTGIFNNNVSPIKEKNEKEIILSENNDWKETCKLAKYDENGKIIEYKIDEKEEIEGYSKLINNTTITNKLNEYNYKVEYYLNGNRKEELTEIYNAPYNKTISEYEDKLSQYKKYKLEKIENLGMKVSKYENKNIIKIYYKEQKFNIKVEETIEKVILNGKEIRVDSKLFKTEIPRKQTKNDIEIYYKIKVSNDSEIKGNTELKFEVPQGYEINNIQSNWRIQENTLRIPLKDMEAGQTKEFIITINNIDQNLLGRTIKKVEAINNTNELDISETTLEDNSDSTEIIFITSTGIQKNPILYIIILVIVSVVVIHKFKNRKINQ